MKKLLSIKWENILVIMMLVSMIMCWVTFLQIPDAYTLALAVIPTFMTLIVIMCYESIKETRQLLKEN